MVNTYFKTLQRAYWNGSLLLWVKKQNRQGLGRVILDFLGTVPDTNTHVPTRHEEIWRCCRTLRRTGCEMPLKIWGLWTYTWEPRQVPMLECVVLKEIRGIYTSKVHKNLNKKQKTLGLLWTQHQDSFSLVFLEPCKIPRKTLYDLMS